MRLLITAVAVAVAFSGACASSDLATESHPAITRINPPEKDFFSKELSFHGIPIKSHEVVSDKALEIAYAKLSMMMAHLPMIVSNLVAAKVELHIIGKDQVTTDLPEWRQDKGKHLEEYHGLTRDQRTRGMGGRLTSCGEENLLKLPDDHYRGRDICLHEFAHAKGRWLRSYAGSNPDEYFAELTMWYFGTHGDMNMTGPKPKNGPEGLKK